MGNTTTANGGGRSRGCDGLGLDPGGGDARGVGDQGDRGGHNRGSGSGSRAHDGGSRGAGHNGGAAGGNGSSGGGGGHSGDAGGTSTGRGRAVGDFRTARGDGDLLGLVDGGVSTVGEGGGQAGEEGDGSSGETHCDCYENGTVRFVLDKVVLKSVAFCRKRVNSWGLERVDDRSRVSD